MIQRSRKKGFQTIAGLLIAAILLNSCATTSRFSAGKGNKYQYTFKMVAPEGTKDLLFQDDAVIVQFRFDEAAIKFQLQNISQSDAVIDWGKMAIGVNGRFYSVRHAGNLYSDSSAKPSLQVPSMGYVRDLGIPRENIYFDGDRWVELDLLPTTDAGSEVVRKEIQQSIGRAISFILPLEAGGVNKTYHFEFQVVSVEHISWKNYHPVKREPPPPQKQEGLQYLDQVTTAIIAVGLLGFAAFVLSVKKSPPSE